MRSIIEKYEGPLTRYAMRLTGDLDSARDVVQEAFLQLCSEDPARMDSHVARWLFTVCRNRALDVRRKERRMQPLSESEVKTGAGKDRDPAKIVEHREGAGRALQVLALLPENQQEVIRLRFQNGLSNREIAGVTKLSISNVGYLIHTAIKKIRERLDARDTTR